MFKKREFYIANHKCKYGNIAKNNRVVEEPLAETKKGEMETEKGEM